MMFFTPGSNCTPGCTACERTSQRTLALTFCTPATVRAAAESAGATDGVRRAVAREVEEAEADQRFSGQWATALDGTANWAQGRGPFTRRDASRAGRSGSLRATRAGDLLTDLTVQGRLRVVQVDANGHAAAWEAVS